MDIKAFSFNSQAKYRTGGHCKEKTVLSLANQEIMVDSHGNEVPRRVGNFILFGNMISSCHFEKSTLNEIPRRGEFHPCHLGA